MVFAHQIRNIIADYLSRKLDLDGFVRAFAPLSYNVVKNGDPAAIRLANGVEAFLVELRAGCISESQFQSAASEMASLDCPNTFVSFSFASAVNSEAQMETAFPAAWQPSGTGLGTECESEAFQQG